MSIALAVLGLMTLVVALAIWRLARSSPTRHRGDYGTHDGAVFAGFDGGHAGAGACDAAGDGGACDGGGGD